MRRTREAIALCLESDGTVPSLELIGFSKSPYDAPSPSQGKGDHPHSRTRWLSGQVKQRSCRFILEKPLGRACCVRFCATSKCPLTIYSNSYGRRKNPLAVSCSLSPGGLFGFSISSGTIQKDYIERVSVPCSCFECELPHDPWPICLSALSRASSAFRYTATVTEVSVRMTGR